MREIRAASSQEVVGVIEPGARAAAALTKTRAVCVIGTSATVSSHAYLRALESLGIAATEKACPLLVPLVEEGWTDHPVTEQVARIYLDELEQQHNNGARESADVLVLGCTHYPLLKPLLHRLVANRMQLVDSAEATADHVATCLGIAKSLTSREADVRFFATDSVEKFRILGSRFLGRSIDEVRLVTLPE
jgi:glutamate racemase